jgi:GntR family transcriptional regulator
MKRRGQTPLALYHQIYVVLREQLMDGTLSQDQALPSEMVLAERYGVSRVTIRATLKKLQSEGLISREKGRGTFARKSKLISRPAPADLRGFMNNLAEIGRRGKTKILEFAYIIPPPDIASQLDLPPDSVVQKAVRLLSYRGEPFAYVTTFLREDIGRTFTRAQLQRGPMLPLLESAGVRLARAEQTVTAKLADAMMAKLLQTHIGSALICMQRTIFDQEDTPIEVNIGFYRPDRYQFQLVMERPGGAPGTEWMAVDDQRIDMPATDIDGVTTAT